ncbi:MAG: type VI secretion system lipoprotein TssJ [bacterium]
MEKLCKTLFLGAVTLVLCTCCARKPKVKGPVQPKPQLEKKEIIPLSPPAPAEWLYEKGAIRLHLKADPQLNLYQGTAYTLSLCIYQLSSPNAFQELMENEEGLGRLLECSRFDASVASYRNIVIQPKQELTESLDRAEGARYVAVVAGYYMLRKEQVTCLLPVPVVEETVDASGAKRLKPGPLSVDLFLGPHGIQETGGK